MQQTTESTAMMPFAARSHPGLKRSNNEDSFVMDEALGLWVVADGVGGHSSGEVASAIACETIRAQVRAGASLESAIGSAHDAVLCEIDSRDADGSDRGSNMGTTVVALRLDGDHYEVAWVGDSRAYLFDRRRAGRLQPLTVDHSAVNDLVADGVLTQQQASTHPQRHALSRSLGVSRDTASAAGVVRGRLRSGEQIILCSDGLTEELHDAAIASELARQTSADGQVDALVEAALAAGGRDNITVIVVGAPAQRGAHHGESRSLETTQSAALVASAADKPRSWLDHKALLLVALLFLVAAVALA
jgi:protein phosphatase